MENTRKPTIEIDQMFIDRWSPRAFENQKLSAETIQKLFEAARWAPSSYNEQPWRFIYATSEEERKKFIDILLEGNQVWAKDAPMIIFLLSKKNWTTTGKQNFHSIFDAGAAWMSLAFQARKLGLYAHAMAGFDREKAFAELNVPKDEYDILIAIAVGKKGDENKLPETLKKMEKPNNRKELNEIVFEGKLR